ncbi:hypothetical protein JHK87_052410 [Glycine soja]|nr:hypothetical protein JHK87_052410 [Glycine soja]
MCSWFLAPFYLKSQLRIDRGHVLGHNMSSGSTSILGGIPIHGGMSTLLRSNSWELSANVEARANQVYTEVKTNYLWLPEISTSRTIFKPMVASMRYKNGLWSFTQEKYQLKTVEVAIDETLTFDPGEKTSIGLEMCDRDTSIAMDPTIID